MVGGEGMQMPAMQEPPGIEAQGMPSDAGPHSGGGDFLVGGERRHWACASRELSAQHGSSVGPVVSQKLMHAVCSVRELSAQHGFWSGPVVSQ